MKRFFLFVCFSIFAICCATPQPVIPEQKEVAYYEITWLDFTQAALDKAKAENKLIYVYAHSNSCYPCVLMNQSTYTDPKVIAIISKNFVPILIEGDDNFELIEEMGASRYPSALIYDSVGNYITTINDFVGADEILPKLKSILNSNSSQSSKPHP